jgi:hypothetical protein
MGIDSLHPSRLLSCQGGYEPTWHHQKYLANLPEQLKIFQNVQSARGVLFQRNHHLHRIRSQTRLIGCILFHFLGCLLQVIVQVVCRPESETSKAEVLSKKHSEVL